MDIQTHKLTDIQTRKLTEVSHPEIEGKVAKVSVLSTYEHRQADRHVNWQACKLTEVGYCKRHIEIAGETDVGYVLFEDLIISDLHD